jgi:error-prone DNA polymerase
MQCSTGAFSHLHVRSGFSWGFGTATPEELVERAAELGMDALALTDRDTLAGIPRFLRACVERDVSPVVGAEVTVQLTEDGGPNGHLVLLADSQEGYRSLCRLISSYRLRSGPSPAERRNPVCDLETLLEHAKGLVCLTGAVPFGLLPRLALETATPGKREEVVSLLREAFGRGNLYAELSDDGTVGSRRRMARVEHEARRFGLPTVATGEVTYLRPRDHRLHEVLVAASSLSSLPPPGYRPTDRLYLGSPNEMTRVFQDRPEALRHVAVLVERCAGAVRLGSAVLVPKANLPTDEEAGRRLLALTIAGAKQRYPRSFAGDGDAFPSAAVLKGRLRRELSCIAALGFCDYFLIAREAVEIARERGIPVTGRGSAANSLVSYCLGLTLPEPFSNRLLFERFMHEGRKDPPDIDLDLDSERRDEVRDELMRRYERNGAAVAATAVKMSLRGAVRVAARALGHPPRKIDELSRLVPTRFTDRGLAYNPLSGWEEALREPAMRGHPLQDRERHRLLLELSSRLYGRLWQPGTHNGGTVFGTGERHLSELVPLEPSGRPGLVRCQYDKDDLEYVGLPKLDLLGLKMHTALRKAGKLVSERLGEEVNPYNLPSGDRETYRLIRTGRNAGMFQLESPGQMNLSTRLKPRKLSDLVAQISLFRPGPTRGNLVTPYVRRRNGQEPYSVILPDLEEVLRPTHGVMVYQEQVLEIAHRVAGLSLAEGDSIRRAMTREKGPRAMRKLGDRFVSRAVKRGVPEEKAREVFSRMEGFSVYGFSAAHGASFAELAYASAYMRTHFPAEFFCGLLNSQPMGFYSPRALLNEARRIGVSVLPPDIHLSEEGFAVEEDGTSLRVGLSYCKGLSRGEISSIVFERRRRPFASVADLYRRTAVERDSLETLVRAGFLDGLGKSRAGLLRETGRLPGKRWRGHQPEIPLPHPVSWWKAREGRNLKRLPLPETAAERDEWEALSLNVRRHPFVSYRAALRKLGVTPSREVCELPHGSRARVAGLIECLQSPPTKSGVPVYFLVVEDESGLLQTTIFRSVYERCGEILHREGAFILEGRVEHTDDRGFAFLISHVRSLRRVLAAVSMPTPRVTPSPGAFLRAGRRGRRAV